MFELDPQTYIKLEDSILLFEGSNFYNYCKFEGLILTLV